MNLGGTHFMSIKSKIRKNPMLYDLAKRIKVFIDVAKNIDVAPCFIREYIVFHRLNKPNNVDHYMDEIRLYPLLKDRKENAGTAGLYLIQDLWAAEKIYNQLGENSHFDIGSRLDGFITHLLSFGKKVILIDIRPLPFFVHEKLNFIQADATNLSNIEDNSIHSLSALCSLEHFGLGRYGDPIDPNACFKAFSSIQKKLAQGGKFYLSLPVGEERIEFNAHRVFSVETILTFFNELSLIELKIATLDPEKPLVDFTEIRDIKKGDFFGLFEFEKTRGED